MLKWDGIGKLSWLAVAAGSRLHLTSTPVPCILGQQVASCKNCTVIPINIPRMYDRIDFCIFEASSTVSDGTTNRVRQTVVSARSSCQQYSITCMQLQTTRRTKQLVVRQRSRRRPNRVTEERWNNPGHATNSDGLPGGLSEPTPLVLSRILAWHIVLSLHAR